MSITRARVVNNRLLTAQELADTTGFHIETIYRRAAAGSIPTLRLGPSLRFDYDEVIDAMRMSAPERSVSAVEQEDAP